MPSPGRLQIIQVMLASVTGSVESARDSIKKKKKKKKNAAAQLVVAGLPGERVLAVSAVSMSAPPVPASVSLPFPAARTVTVTVAVAEPSRGDRLIAVPCGRAAAVAVMVRLAPAPVEAQIGVGTSAWLFEAPLSVRLADELSGSATARLTAIQPQRSSAPQAAARRRPHRRRVVEPR